MIFILPFVIFFTHRIQLQQKCLYSASTKMLFEILEIDPHISIQKHSNILGAKYLTFEIILLFCKGIFGMRLYLHRLTLLLITKLKVTKTF